MIASVLDRGLFLTSQAIRRQLAAMPCDLYLIRLIHHATKRPFPGERLWTAVQLSSVATVRFLRIRNREGCDVYIQPYADHQNAGYILIDLDVVAPAIVDRMRANGHDPCVVLQTSPGHLQAWIHLSTAPLPPVVATAAGKQLAHLYGGDLASADWRHLGRLAGFTNQKPERRTLFGCAPWVKIMHARAGLAPHADRLLQSVRALPHSADAAWRPPLAAPPHITTAEATEIYFDCVKRWRIPERFPQPDWSIVDLWIARALLSRGTPAAQVQTILRLASPQFPRRHGDPQDYLQRTLARAGFPFPAYRRAVCAPHTRASPAAAIAERSSNSTGGR
jgi:hypothetical protein